MLGWCASTRIVITPLASLKHILPDVQNKSFSLITRGRSSPKYIKKTIEKLYSYK